MYNRNRGALTMIVADPMPGGRRNCISAKSSADFVRWVRERAARRGVSVSHLIEAALALDADRSGDAPPPAR